MHDYLHCFPDTILGTQRAVDLAKVSHSLRRKTMGLLDSKPTVSQDSRDGDTLSVALTMALGAVLLGWNAESRRV